MHLDTEVRCHLRGERRRPQRGILGVGVVHKQHDFLGEFVPAVGTPFLR